MSRFSQVIGFILLAYMVQCFAKNVEIIKDVYFWCILGTLLMTFLIQFFFYRLELRRAIKLEAIKEERLDRFERMKRNRLREFDRLNHEEIH